MINISLDATILSTLESCPTLANYKFNQHLVTKEGKSNAIECGLIAHIIKEYSNKALIDGISRANSILAGFTAGEIFINSCPDCKNPDFDCKVHKNEWTGLENTPEISDKKFIGWQYVLDTMNQYFDFYKNDSFTVLGAEEVRGKVIYESSDLRVLWKAKFDEIIDTPSGIMSRDTKTMSQRRPSNSMSNQFIGQCVILGSRQVMVDKIGWQTSLKPEEKFIRTIIPYSVNRMLEWSTIKVPYYARMLAAYSEAGTWPMNWTHCENKFGACDFRKVCECDSNTREEMLNVYFKVGRKWDIAND